MTATPPDTGSDLAPEAEPVVVYDVFPAEVTVAGVTHRLARVIATEARIYVYTPGRKRVAELAYTAELDRAGSSIPEPGTVRQAQAHLTAAGQPEPTVHVTPLRSCGCSASWLRSFRPFDTYRSGKR